MESIGNYWLETILDQSMEMIVFFDERGKILGCNQVVVDELGFTKEGIRGLNVGQIIDMPVEKKDGKIVIHFLENDYRIMSVYRKNKTCFPVKVRVTKTEHPNSMYIAFGMNYTEQEKVLRNLEREREKVENAQKVRNEFVSNVTHELRTPINGIKGHAQILAETELNTEQKERVKIIVHACENMEQLVNGILDYSKLEAGKFDLEEREFSFTEFVKYVEEVNRVAIESKGLQFYVHLDSNIPEKVIGDSLRITQVLNNLLSNARKFTATGQIALEISLTNISETKAEVFFIVMDTGIGIAEEDKDKLFKEFSQVDASIARQYGGTGLGLAISKRLVELMNGNIRVESTKGKGTTFSFSVVLGLVGEEAIVQEQEEDVSPTLMAARPKLKIARESEGKKLEGEEFQFGSNINREEVCINLEKMVLCLDMGRYGKAEEFLDQVKNLLKNGPEDVQKQLFRMGMSVRKEDYEKSLKNHDKLRSALEAVWGGGMRPWK